MAIFRKVHTSIWSDSFFSELDRDKKLFYIYLLTNERTKQCGVYEITKRQISFDLGYTMDRVSILLKYFISKDKIRYNDKTFELGLRNWLKYNSSTSPKMQTCINQEFSIVKDTVLIQYVKGMYTESQEEQEEEQEEEKNNKKAFIAPSQLMVSEYFKENKYKEETAIKAFTFYDVANWKDSKGNQIKNWKQKMIGVWFTPENKSKKELSREDRFVR